MKSGSLSVIGTLVLNEKWSSQIDFVSDTLIYDYFLYAVMEENRI